MSIYTVIGFNEYTKKVFYTVVNSISSEDALNQVINQECGNIAIVCLDGSHHEGEGLEFASYDIVSWVDLINR